MLWKMKNQQTDHMLMKKKPQIEINVSMPSDNRDHGIPRYCNVDQTHSKHFEITKTPRHWGSLHPLASASLRSCSANKMVLKPSRLTASRSLKGSLFSKRTWKAPVNPPSHRDATKPPFRSRRMLGFTFRPLKPPKTIPSSSDKKWIFKSSKWDHFQTQQVSMVRSFYGLALKERLTSASCWAQSSCTEDKKSASARSSHDQSSGGPAHDSRSCGDVCSPPRSWGKSSMDLNMYSIYIYHIICVCVHIYIYIYRISSCLGLRNQPSRSATKQMLRLQET